MCVCVWRNNHLVIVLRKALIIRGYGRHELGTGKEEHFLECLELALRERHNFFSKLIPSQLRVDHFINMLSGQKFIHSYCKPWFSIRTLFNNHGFGLTELVSKYTTRQVIIVIAKIRQPELKALGLKVTSHNRLISYTHQRLLKAMLGVLTCGLRATTMAMMLSICSFCLMTCNCW